MEHFPNLLDHGMLTFSSNPTNTVPQIMRSYQRACRAAQLSNSLVTGKRQGLWDKMALKADHMLCGPCWPDSPEMASGSGLLPDSFSTDMVLPSAPTPQPRGPMALERRRSWISSEILSRLFRAALYSPFARASLA